MPANKKRGGHNKHAPTNASASDHVCSDPWHNSDQPCCQLLTNFARQIFPIVAENSSTAVESSSEALPTLLREYLLEERRQRRKVGGPVAKKKRKKKKKKKGGPSITTNDNNSDNPLPIGEEEEIANGASPSAQTQPLQESIPAESSPTTVATNEMNGGASPKSPNGDNTTAETRLQEERFRRIRILLDRFIDSRLPTTDIEAPDTKTTVDPQQQLTSFIAASLNDEDAASAAGKTTQQQESPRSSKQGAKATEPAKPIMTFISAKQVERAIQAIQCPECRLDVERILLPTLQKPSPNQDLVLLEGLRIPTIYDTYHDQEQEEEVRAFQYQLMMEEGTTPPANLRCWSFELISGAEQEDKNETSSTNKSSSSAAGWLLRRPLIVRAHPFESSDLEFLLHQYVLMLGIPPDEVTGAATRQGLAAENVICSIVQSVDSKVETILNDFRRMATEICETIGKFRELSDDADSGNIDWQKFPVMKDTDEHFDVVLDTLLRIITEITRSVQSTLSHISAGIDVAVAPATEMESQASGNTLNPDGSVGAVGLTREEALADCHCSITQCSDLWRIFLEGIRKILEQMFLYEDRLFALADRHGKVPDKFISSSSRSLYRQYIDAKFRIVSKTMNAIEKRISHPTSMGDWTDNTRTNNYTHFVRRVFADEAFYQVVASMEGRKHLRRQPMDTACEDVLQTIRELTETVHEGYTAAIIERHQQRRRKLSRLAVTVVENVNASLEYGSSEDLTVLKDLRQDVESLQMSTPSEDASPDEQMESQKAWISVLGSEMVRATKSWVEYRLHYNIEGNERKCPAVMPHVLKQRICQSLAYITSHSLHESKESSSCHGGNGRSRAACILVGLFFQQLSEGYKEWHAHLAAMELLTNIEDDDVMAAQVATKANKKSKKKKSKKANPSDEERKLDEKDAGKIPSHFMNGTANVLPLGEAENKQASAIVLIDATTSDDEMRENSLVGDSSKATDGQSEQPASHGVGSSLRAKTDAEAIQRRPNESSAATCSENAYIPVKALDTANATPEEDSDHKRPAPNRKPSDSRDEHKQVRSENTTEPKVVNGANKKKETSAMQAKLTITTAESSSQDDGREKTLLEKEEERSFAHKQASMDKYNQVALDRLYAVVKVGVYDKSGFQSAENFLVGKMATLTNQGEDNISRI